MEVKQLDKKVEKSSHRFETASSKRVSGNFMTGKRQGCAQKGTFDVHPKNFKSHELIARFYEEEE